MSTRSIDKRQRGVVLVVSLLFLLVVTVISVTAASNSNIGLRMAANTQDYHSSFHSAEAGVLAVMMLVDTADDTFDGNDSLTPFAGFSAANHPLKDLNDSAAAVDVDVYFTGQGLTCPRREEGSSVGLFNCDYYRIESEHDVAERARTQVDMGVVKTVIGSSAQ